MNPLRSLLVGGTILAAAALAACGGGGGGSTPSAPTTATPIPTAAPSPQIASVYPAAYDNAAIQFSCGCTAQAGTATVDSTGNLTIGQSTPAMPATPNPTYTIVPGRNYIVIATTAANQQAWTMVYDGNTISRNFYLGGMTTVDTAATLAALYVINFSPVPTNSTVGEPTFDDWNFNAISAWTTHLRNTSALTATETHAISDIMAQQNADQLLYPVKPLWNQSVTTNSTIVSDLNAIHADTTATTVPTPCPTSASDGTAACTGAPSP